MFGGGGGSRTRVPEALYSNASPVDSNTCDNPVKDQRERLGVMFGVGQDGLEQLIAIWPDLKPSIQQAIWSIAKAAL